MQVNASQNILGQLFALQLHFPDELTKVVKTTLKTEKFLQFFFLLVISVGIAPFPACSISMTVFLKHHSFNYDSKKCARHSIWSIVESQEL